MSVQEKFGGELSEEEFRKFTLYTTQSNNFEDDNSRAKILGFVNERVRIAPGAVVRIGDNQIGARSYVGLYSYVNGDVSIGENVLIGPHASIVASNHVYSVEDDFFSGRSDLSEGKVIIKDGVWLTSGVVITPGVTIGRCSLVCANSVVTNDVEDYAIVGGTPAVQLGKIDKETGQYTWFKQEK
ncbi:DapH/DapD/GlmU-related protein [Psychromonas sp. 14N.309.X.WAT.B.A12]|jgi:acetyltransferase-like isoleucine patch superfamily enzyme|uniref:acyltransferase n=1 Tax=unclassified Psychromonas TaxID=2614957 RepID=UPI0025B0D311|nr:acyltransferase [Psychromonas sp. 14N.309.X.WAT.B.A12]MDN2663472.1 acyltransferase [Psychromonas sp. 14N.309.X.WAT.B.A12]